MTIKSQFPHAILPETDLFSFIFKRKDRPFPDDHIIYQDADTDKAYSYAAVRRMAEDFGKGMKGIYGWRKGEVLALFTMNNIDVPPIIYGTLWAGGIVSPANPGYTAAELAHQLKDSGARAIVTQRAVLPTVQEACRAAGIADDHIILLGEERDPSGRAKHWTSVRNISGSTRYRATKISPKTDLAFLVYSSGTTGKPKGVRLSHYNLTSNVSQLQPGEQFNLTWDGSKTSGDIPLPPPGAGGDKILACLPFFHIYGLTVTVHCPLFTGVTTIVLARFDIEKWCALVQKHRITYSYIVPPIVLLLSKHPVVASYDLSSIRMTNSGAAPLTRELVEAVYKRTGIRVKQGYGLSETSPTAFQQSWDDWRASAGSVGWLMPNMEAKFCTPISSGDGDSSGPEPDELPPGSTGELYVRGPNVFQGYHANAAATAECLSADGWFRTGDVGYIEYAGNLFITDRVKELIKYKGFQVAPAELEGVLIDHPHIDDCAVVGMYSELLGTEVPRAYVVPKGGLSHVIDPLIAHQKAGEIVGWLNAKVASHKRLRGGIRFVGEVPKTVSGKILRRTLKEMAKKEMEENMVKVKGNSNSEIRARL